jgi:hypothetical protein
MQRLENINKPGSTIIYKQEYMNKIENLVLLILLSLMVIMYPTYLSNL